MKTFVYGFRNFRVQIIVYIHKYTLFNFKYICRPDRCMQISKYLIRVFQQFLHHDYSCHHDYASRSWGHLLDMLYPGLTSITDLALKLSLICEKAFANRLFPPSHMCQFLEFRAGSANLTRSLLQAGFDGSGFDWSLSEAHNCLCRNDLKLWMDMLMSVCRDGLVWLGPPCSLLSFYAGASQTELVSIIIWATKPVHLYRSEIHTCP